VTVVAVAWLAACQEPFAEDRHDLAGFRIAAVEVAVSADGAELTPRAAVVVDGRPWAAEAATLDWYQVADVDAVEELGPNSPVDATGPAPILAAREDRPVLALVARHDDLEERGFAVLDPPVDAGTFLAVFATRPSGEIVDGVAVDETVRLTADLFGPRGVVHWMSTAGTFYELAPLVTEWTADVEVEQDVTILALHLGAKGGTTWHVREIHAGTPGPGLWIGQRWLPTDVGVDVPPGEAVRGTLIADAGSPLGVTLVEPTVVPATSVEWGTAALPCAAPVEGPFDPNWLLLQICGRDDVVDHRVGVLPEAAR